MAQVRFLVIPALLLAAVASAQSGLPGDANGDGKLERSEFESYVNTRMPDFDRMGAFFEAVDADGDGFLSPAEFANRMEALQTVRSQPEAPEAEPAQALDLVGNWILRMQVSETRTTVATARLEQEAGASGWVGSVTADGDELAAGAQVAGDEVVVELVRAEWRFAGRARGETITGTMATPFGSFPTVMTRAAVAEPTGFGGVPAGTPATVLLVTASELAEAWKPYAEWKTGLGKATKIITIDTINGSYEAEGVQERVRLCVRDHIDNHGTRWVVLGGDSLRGDKGLVPGGHTTVHAQERKGIPTDIVYLSKTNWDADGDGIFGEWSDDRDAISYPDGSVGLGRVPVRTAADVAAFTAKVIAYESSYPTTDFAKQMIYTCTDSPAYPKVRNSWDGFVSKVWDGSVGRFFSEETPWDQGKPGSYPLSPGNLVKLLNGRSASKLHIHGHGHLPSWVLETAEFSASHVDQLTNDGAYPLITTVSCNTGEYDGTDPSIVEAMIRKPLGGSVAVVAPVRTGKPHFHQRSDFRLMVTEGKLDGTTQTMTRYWAHGLGDGMTTGQSFMQCKADMAEDARKTQSYHLCICELNLLGDPTLDMRASVPLTPELELPASATTGKQKIEVATGAPGSTVCLWKAGEVYATATADAEGRATLEVAPATTGDLRVTVWGASLNTVSHTLEVR